MRALLRQAKLLCNKFIIPVQIPYLCVPFVNCRGAPHGNIWGSEQAHCRTLEGHQHRG